MKSQNTTKCPGLLRLFLVLLAWHLLGYIALTCVLTPCLKAWAATPIDYIRTSNVDPQVFWIIMVVNIKQLLPAWHWIALLLIALLVKGLLTPAVQGVALLFSRRTGLAASFRQTFRRIRPFSGQAVFHFVLVALLVLSGVLLTYWVMYYRGLMWLGILLFMLAEIISLWNFGVKVYLTDNATWLMSAVGSLRLVFSRRGAAQVVIFAALDVGLLLTTLFARTLPLTVAPIVSVAILSGITTIKFHVVNDCM